MIYLRHAFAASGLAVPRTVDIVVDDIAVDSIEWLVAQVRSEMEALRASLQARQASEKLETSGQKTQAGNPKPDACDEKATASDSTPEDQKPDEPGEIEGGRSAAA